MHRALRLLRTYHHLKQIDLAERLGISGSYLSEIEAGDKAPGLDMLEKYAEIFKMPVSSILLFSEKMAEGGKRRTALHIVAADKILRLLEFLGERDAIKKRA